MAHFDDSYDIERSFAAAAQEFGVPVDLLKAIGYVESRGEHRRGSPSFDGGYGVMNLRESASINTLEEASRVLGIDKSTLVRDPVQNIRGAAAVLREYHRLALDSGPTEDAWKTALKQYSGRVGEDADRYMRDIEHLLREGLEHVTESGTTFTITGSAQAL